MKRPTPINQEVTFDNHEFIISKTNLKGEITYCNELFTKIAGYTTKELIGTPHSILRHPDMPKIIFKLLWEHLQDGEEIFAFVKNLTADGKYYWVLAFVTPTRDSNGKIFEYFSVRRKPKSQTIINTIDSLYKTLLSAEKSGGISASKTKLDAILNEKGLSYEEFIFSL